MNIFLRIIFLFLLLLLLVSCSKNERGHTVVISETINETSDTLYVINDSTRTLTVDEGLAISEHPAYGTANITDSILSYTPNGGYVGKDTAILTKSGQKTTIYFYVFDRPDFTNVPNDTYLNGVYQNRPEYWWGMTDIKAHLVWDTHSTCIDTVGDTLRIGVIDSGIDKDHPELENIVETTLQKNFIDDNTDTTDEHGHGTHIAGVIASEAQNSLGFSGVCQAAKLVALKVLDADGLGTSGDMIDAIEYATANNILITNNSYGFVPEDNGGGASNWESYLFGGEMNTLSTKIQNNRAAGHLFIAAAGNSGVDNDTILTLPANYAKFTAADKTDNVISVGALDADSSLVSFSNYGDETVNIAAPGSRIFSTYPNDQIALLSGSSMAAPFVTGIAALIWAKKLNDSKSPTYEDIKDSLTHSSSVADFTDKEKTINQGKVDVQGSIDRLDVLVP